MSKTEHVGTATKYSVPDISKDDLFAFHLAHFCQDAVVSFGNTFVNPASEQQPYESAGYEDWEEDDLGYYEDGVKRTLTDEQIEIFRHSELEALRREQERQADAKTSSSSDDMMEFGEENSTPMVLVNADPNPTSIAYSGKKKKKKKGVKRARPEPKPDLRKRTWDIVEKGLDTLDYD